jgi:nickel/cobalt transporter (NicO) family protein
MFAVSTELLLTDQMIADVNGIVFVTLAATGFAVGFLHAVIPTHWLPFVVAARAQRWRHSKTLAVTAFAGAGHVLFTTALGALVVWAGMALNSRIGKTFPFIAGGALIALGIFYLIRQVRGHGGHVHLFGDHTHAHSHSDDPHSYVDEAHEQEAHVLEQNWSRGRSDWAAITGLIALLTFSPCEAFFPVFLTGAKYGWLGFALLSSVLAIATVTGMVTFTSLTLLGLQHFRFIMLEKFEPLIVSAVFCVLGVLVILLEH